MLLLVLPSQLCVDVHDSGQFYRPAGGHERPQRGRRSHLHSRILVADQPDVTPGTHGSASDALRLAAVDGIDIALLGLLADEAPIGIALFDRDLRYTYANRFLERAHGRNPVGLTLWQVMPDLADVVAERLRRMLETGETLEGQSVTGATGGLSGIAAFDSTYFPVRERGRVIGVGSLFRDVTAQRRVPGLLSEPPAESEQRFRSLLEDVQLAATITDGDSTIVFANEYLARLTGYEVDELVGARWLDLLVPADQREGEDRFYRDLKEKGIFSPHDVAVPLLTRDGEVRLMTWSNTPVHDDQGRVWAVAGIGEDITDQLRASEALEEQRQIYQTLVERMPMVTYRDSPDGAQGFYVSPQLGTMFGYTPEQWFAPVGERQWYEQFAHPDDVGSILHVTETAAAVGSLECLITYRIRHADGSYRWISDEMTLVTDDTGVPLWRQGIIRDITDQVNAEADRDRQRHLYQTLVEQIPLVTFVTEPSGAPLYVSPQLEAIMGLSPEQWLSMSAAERLSMIHPDDLAVSQQAIGAVYAGRADSYDVHVRMLRPDGQERHVQLMARSVRGSGAEVTAVEGAMIDTTALHAAERRSREVMATMVNAVEAEQARIAAELHDDTVQLMTALLMKVQMLRRDVPQLAKFEPMLAAGLERTRRLMFEMRPQILDSAGVTSALSEVAADGPWSTLELDIDLPRQSTTTETIVYRCVRELIVNARKHSRASRLSIRGYARQATRSCSTWTMTRVGFDVQGALDTGAQPDAPGTGHDHRSAPGWPGGCAHDRLRAQAKERACDSRFPPIPFAV